MVDVVFSVAQVNEYISRKIFSDPFLSRINVAGEITNLTFSTVGHAFFSLKDKDAMIGCIMYDYMLHEDKDKLGEGASIEIGGRLTFYKKNAAVQLVVESVKPKGTGDLFELLEKTRKKLSEEGLFLESNKKPLPFFTARLGVVTSAAGAVLHDIINVATRRFAGVSIIVHPAQVQGAQAAADICRAISFLNEQADVDVIIVARGGGSFEDLSAFNEESVVRAVFESKIPIVSAVGHETDYTLCDMAADLRAPTPSVAAELVVKEKSSLLDMIAQYKSQLTRAIAHTAEIYEKNFKMYKEAILRYPLSNLLNQAQSQISLSLSRAESAMESTISQNETKLVQYGRLLDSLNPRNVLSRGYSIVFDCAGNIVKSADFASGELEIEFQDGRAYATGRGR